MMDQKANRAASDLPPTERSLPIVLMRAREKVMAPIREMLADAGITEQQWRILRVLAEVGPLDATHLADRACLLLPSLTRTSRLMIENGYITRSTDQGDRRRLTLAITPKGRKLIDDNRQNAAAIAASYRSTLGAERYELLLDLLQELERL